MSGRAALAHVRSACAGDGAGAGAANRQRRPLQRRQPQESPASPVPEEELLEFLGSLDAEGEEWAEYLTETDIEKVAESETAPAAPEGKKDE